MYEILTARVVCDRCGKQLLLRTPEQFENFELTWFEGVIKDFCPTCGELPEVKKEIEQQREITARFDRDFDDEEFPEVLFDV